MVWLLKNLVVLRTTLQIISISLYKIEEFHFTDCKNHGKDLAIPADHRQKIRNDALDFIESRATAIGSI